MCKRRCKEDTPNRNKTCDTCGRKEFCRFYESGAKCLLEFNRK